MELAIVSHFFPRTFEYLSKCALSKTLFLKEKKNKKQGKGEISTCSVKGVKLPLKVTHVCKTVQLAHL